ncbi:MFS transporter [Nakamurella multipartita]|uniref:MFS transporter n=1 Tax=Nakamurella multipartita TaxID=53461 RepID=UPI0009FC3068|nr:MFS transporter [Nakamurella multipartita]
MPTGGVGPTPATASPARAWTMLALGTAAQTAGTVFVSTPAFLIPLLHEQRSLSLAQAGLVASAPLVGLVLSLIAWGALADRRGERLVIASGLALTAVATVGAMFSTGYVALGLFFVLGGVGAASTNAASGRVVVGWFAKDRRGLAMGVRQIAQPLGTTLAAVIVPTAAESGIDAALAVPLIAVAPLAVICAIGIRNPPRPASAPALATANPYRGSGFLWRIHLVSVLLVVPQYTLALFGLLWLIAGQGWDPIGAGLVIGAAQFVGALGRIGAGVLSDRIGSRVRPLRWISLAAAASMLALAAAAATQWSLAPLVLVVATTISVADNGLAFTSVAEVAGPVWAGRALGVQNTGQFVAAAAVGPVVGVLITVLGYPLAFAASAVAPVLATPLIPDARAERDRL